MATSISPPPSTPARATSRAGWWFARASALLTILLLGAGGLQLASWLRTRSEARQTETAIETSLLTPPPEMGRGPGPDARMGALLHAGVLYGPIRATPFGLQEAWMVPGSSRLAPDRVFADLREADRQRMDRDAQAALLRGSPSLQRLLRTVMVSGSLSGGAYLVKMPLDVLAAQRGEARLEPGGIILAFDGSDRWEYVTFYFPSGLDLADFGRPADTAVLARLSPRAVELLDPLLLVPGGPTGGMTSTSALLCRARGAAGIATARVARTLQDEGWRLQEAADPAVTVLEGPRGVVCLHCPEPDALGGIVTVMLASP